MRRFFSRHLDLWLSAAGLLVVGAASVLAPAGLWLPVALAVFAVHGVAAWAVRRRQRRTREAVIGEIREVLADVVRADLPELTRHLPPEHEAALRRRLDGLTNTLAHVAAQVDGLSEERPSARVYPHTGTAPGALAFGV